MVEYDDENPHAEASFMSHGGGGATDHERDDNINERDDAREHDDEEAGGEFNGGNVEAYCTCRWWWDVGDA